MSEQYGVGGKDNMVAALKAKNVEPLLSTSPTTLRTRISPASS